MVAFVSNEERAIIYSQCFSLQNYFKPLIEIGQYLLQALD